MKRKSYYSCCRDEQEPVTRELPSTGKLKSIWSIRRDRIYRLSIIPLFLISMAFVLIPSLLVIMELAGRLILENQILGILGTISGILICIFLLIRALTFFYRDLFFESTFVTFLLISVVLISIGNMGSSHSLSFGDLANRYKTKFNSMIEWFKDQPYVQDETKPNTYNLTQFDSVALEFKDHADIVAFSTYASRVHYNDMLSQGLYFKVCPVMSLYRVVLEEFEVTYHSDTQIMNINPQEIIELLEADHSEITLFFAACLKNLDYLVRVRKNLQGRLVTEISISTSTYFDIGNFFAHEEWNFVPLNWYMFEFIVEEPGIDAYILPLYIPISNVQYGFPGD